MWITANAKWYVGWNAWWVYSSWSDFYQEFVTTCHNAYLQDTEELTGLATLQEQINWNVEYYYNNLSAWWHIVENSWSIEQWLVGVVWVFDWVNMYTYDVISWQEILNDDFDFNTHMWLYYWWVSWWENPDFWFRWWE